MHLLVLILVNLLYAPFRRMLASTAIATSQTAQGTKRQIGSQLSTQKSMQALCMKQHLLLYRQWFHQNCCFLYIVAKNDAVHTMWQGNMVGARNLCPLQQSDAPQSASLSRDSAARKSLEAMWQTSSDNLRRFNQLTTNRADSLLSDLDDDW